MERYYFCITDLYICITFHTTIWVYFKEKLKGEIVNYLNDFKCDKKPNKINFYIDIIWENGIKYFYIKKYKEVYIEFYRASSPNRIICHYRISLYEFQTLLGWILIPLLLKNNGFIIHASSVLINDRVNLFLGSSRSGKSTIRCLLTHPYLPLSDDSSIIKYDGNDYYHYQTPFFEKDPPIDKSHRKYPIDKIFFIKKASHFRIKKINNKKELLDKLFNQVLKIRLEKDQKDILIKILLKFMLKKMKNIYSLYFAKDKKGLLKILKTV